MQKVAEVAGVSKSSVSLALRDDPRLAYATRRRIQEIAARLGYRKNPIVASLMTQLRFSQTPKFQANLALINGTGQRNFSAKSVFQEYRDGIRERAERAGYGLEDFWANEPGMKPARLAQILQTRGIRGLVLTVEKDPDPAFADARGVFRSFCVAVAGVDRMDPPLPRAASDFFRATRHAVETAFQLGYSRPGLVIPEHADRRHDRRISAGYRSAVTDHLAGNHKPLPPLVGDAIDQRVFSKWIHTARPDIVVTALTEVREWLENQKRKVPDDVGLIHLEWTPELEGWAGMRHNTRLVGAAAADLVISRITNSEFGPPEHPRLVLIDSDFVPGPSVRSRAESQDDTSNGRTERAAPKARMAGQR